MRAVGSVPAGRKIRTTSHPSTIFTAHSHLSFAVAIELPATGQLFHRAAAGFVVEVVAVGVMVLKDLAPFRSVSLRRR